MKKFMKKLTVAILTLAMVFTMMPRMEFTKSYAETTDLSNPKYGSVETFFDCVYFGSYPQREVVKEKSECCTAGKKWEKDSDCIVDSDLFRNLEKAGWEDNFATWEGNTYKREKIYYYPDSDEYWYYRYFKCEPIKWRVLDVTGNDAFLLADVGLDNQAYTGNSWDESGIRNFAKYEFTNTAFTESEQAAIKSTSLGKVSDKVFLLSREEACKKSYGFRQRESMKDQGAYELMDARQVRTSTYAKAKGAFADDSDDYLGKGQWYLRDTDWVEMMGNIKDPSQATGNKRAFRPALHLDLSKTSVWSKAGKVSSFMPSVLEIKNDRDEVSSVLRLKLNAYANSGIDGYYFGKDSNAEPTKNPGDDVIDGMIEIINEPGSYCFKIKDYDGNINYIWQDVVEIKLNVVGADYSFDGDDTILALCGDDIKLPKLTVKEGYVEPDKIEWKDSEDPRFAKYGNEATYKARWNTELIAKFKEKTATITYDTLGGSDIKPTKMTFTEDTLITSSEPIKEGFSFRGWSKSSADGAEAYYDPGDFYRWGNDLERLKDITLYAVYGKEYPEICTKPKLFYESNFTYDGNPHELVFEGSALDGKIEYAIGTDDKTAPTEGWDDRVPKKTHAGTYHVWFRVKSDDLTKWDNIAPEYVGAVTIKKAEQEILGDDKVMYTYKDTNKSVPLYINIGNTLTYEVVSGDSVDVNPTTGELTIKKIGVSKVKVTAPETENYLAGERIITIQITGELITKPTANTLKTYTYNGNEQKYEPMNIKDIDKIDVSGDAKATDAGTYVVIYTPKEGYTFRDGSDSCEIEWTIQRKKWIELGPQIDGIPLSPENEDGSGPLMSWIQRDGDVHKFNSINKMDILSVSGDSVTVDASGNITVKKPGDTVMTVEVKDSKNYDIANADQKFVIKVRVYDEVVAMPEVKEYKEPFGDFNYFTPDKFDSDKMEITNNTVFEEGSHIIWKQPGTYKSVVSLKEGHGYMWEDGTFNPIEIEWEIEPSQNMFWLAKDEIQEFEYGKDDQFMSFASRTYLEGLSYEVVSGDSVAVDAETGKLTTLNVGKSVVRVTAPASGGRKETALDVDVIVNKGTQNIVVEKIDGKAGTSKDPFVFSFADTPKLVASAEGPIEYKGDYWANVNSKTGRINFTNDTHGEIRDGIKIVAKETALYNEQILSVYTNVLPVEIDYPSQPTCPHIYDRYWQDGGYVVGKGELLWETWITCYPREEGEREKYPDTFDSSKMHEEPCDSFENYWKDPNHVKIGYCARYAGDYVAKIVPNNGYVWKETGNKNAYEVHWTLEKEQQEIKMADELKVGLDEETISLSDEAMVYGTTYGTGIVDRKYELISGDSVSVNSSTGVVTLKKEGVSVVEITAEESQNFTEAKKQVTIKVLDSKYGLHLPKLEGEGFNENYRENQKKIAKKDKVTWDCVEFGTYPQTEVVPDESKGITYGKLFQSENDVIVDSNLYDKLENEDGWKTTSKYQKFGDTKDEAVKEVDGFKYQRVSDGDYNNRYFRYEPIKWRVIDLDGDDAYLWADVALDEKSYRSFGTYDGYGEHLDYWASSSLRTWMNNESDSSSFINTAFNDEEQNAIISTKLENKMNQDYIHTSYASTLSGGDDTIDKVFILADYEVYSTKHDDSPLARRYGICHTGAKIERQRKALLTPYARTKDGQNSKKYTSWLVRTPGCACSKTNVVYVNDAGAVSVIGGSIGLIHGIRPAIHLDLSKGGWEQVDSYTCTSKYELYDDENSKIDTSVKGNEIDFSKDVWHDGNYSDDLGREVRAYDLNGYYDHAFFNADTEEYGRYQTRYLENYLYSKFSDARKQYVDDTYFCDYDGESEKEYTYGHCYGLSASVISTKMGILPEFPDCSAGSGLTIGGYLQPKWLENRKPLNNVYLNSHFVMDSTGYCPPLRMRMNSYVAYYQISQDLKPVQNEIQNFMKKDLKEQLLDIETKVKEVETSGCPVLIGFSGPGWGHAVVGYRAEKGEFRSDVSELTYNRRILLYDSNANVADPYYCLLYNCTSKTPRWEIPAYYESGATSLNNDAALNCAINDENIISTDYASEDEFGKVSVDPEIVLEGDSFYTVKNGDKELEIDRKIGSINGDPDFVTYSEFTGPDDEELSPTHVVLPNGNKSCSINTTNGQEEQLGAKLLSDDTFVALNASSAKEANINPNGEATIEGNTGIFEMTVAKQGDENTSYTVGGKGQDNVSLAVNDNGTIDLEGDNLKGLTLTATASGDASKKFKVTDDAGKINLEVNLDADEYEGENAITINKVEPPKKEEKKPDDGPGTPTGPETPTGPGTPSPIVEVDDNDQPVQPIVDKDTKVVVAKTSLKAIKAGKNFITLSWAKKSVTGYQVQYSTSSSFKKSATKVKTISKAKTTSVKLTKLKSNKKYYVRVRSYKKVNGKAQYSAWSGKKSVKTKK